MAPSLGKKLSFKDLKNAGPGKNKSAYPEKTYINLVQIDKRTLDIRRSIPTAIAAVIIIALFAKFGVIDFYDRMYSKQSELAAQVSQLDTLNHQLENYNTVLEEYEGYKSMSLAEGGLAVDALDALRLVDTFIAPVGNISTLSLTGDTLSLSLTDVSLDSVGQLASLLRGQEMVKDVSVSTASTRSADREGVTAAMTIKLVSPTADFQPTGGSASSSSSSKASK